MYGSEIVQTTNMLEDAQARSEAKWAVKHALRALDSQAARQVLADLLVDMTNEAKEASVKRPVGKVAKKAPRKVTKTKTRAPRRAPGQMKREAPTPGRVGRPMGSTAGSAGRTSTLLSYLRDHPRASIKAVAAAIYGSADQTAQNKTRSLMNAQKKRGMIKNVGPGLWEAVTAT